MLNAVIIDDEQDLINALLIKLSLVCPEVKVLKSFTNATDAILFLHESTDINILFLDIEMPNLDGFQLLDSLPAKNYEVVMVTAYPQFAINAIKANAIDYLLKPVDMDELRKAVNKVMLKQQQQVKVLNQINELTSLIKALQPQDEKILLHSTKDAVLVPLSEIVRVSGEGSYSVFYLKDNSRITISKNLKEYETYLEKHHFFRIHKSHIININFLKRLIKADTLSVQMIDDTILEVSIRRRTDFLQLLESNLYTD